MKIRRTLFLSMALATCASAPSHAQAQTEAAAHWRALAEIDLAAAHALIVENHPGAAVELGDVAFQMRLEQSYQTARSRLPMIDSYPSYTATLAAFAIGLEDKHISFVPFAGPRIVKWPGFIVARRGSEWRVTRVQPGGKTAELQNARLVSCEGEPADNLAARRLGGFKAVWSVEAQRIGASPYLLIDEGNALSPTPASCVFEVDGQPRTEALDWQWAPMNRLQPMIDASAPKGAAGLDVRPFQRGWWIGVQTLSPATVAVIDKAKAVQSALSVSPYVIVDVRGNEGGNSRYADELAEVLLGPDTSTPQASASPSSETCPAAWRASKDNLATLQTYRRDFGPDFGPAYVAEIEQTERAMRDALEQGRNFSFDVTGCLERAADMPPEQRRFPMPVAILTDRACFSSCLLMVQRFRALGAVQIGAATDANPSYMEQRQVLLPSGVGLFAVQQKVSFSQSPLIGPFVPEHVFDGDISDTSALENWISQSVIPRFRPSLP